jgi:hypothetical protein
MHRDGLLEPGDLSPAAIRDDILAEVRGPDGLWFTAKHLIGMDRLNERIHKPGQRWFQEAICHPDAVLAYRDPRSSGKTSSITISFPFWLWAQVPEPGTPQQGINSRIAIVAPKKEIASYSFLARIIRVLNESAAYRQLCPWVKIRTVSLKTGLLLQRLVEVGDPSITPVGMESVSTSFHFDFGFVDDPIHEQNYFSQIEVSRIVEWMFLSRNLVRSEHGALGFIGNFWRIGDVQDQLRPSNPYFKDVRIWERGLTGCDECVNGRPEGHQHSQPIFPIALLNADGTEPGPEFIDAARDSMPTYMYQAQCENQPVDASTLHFQSEWLKQWSWHHTPGGEPAIRVNTSINHAKEMRQQGNYNFTVGESLGAHELIPLAALDFYILIDPAPSEQASSGHSRFAIATVACERAGNRRFLIEEYAKNAPAHEHINAILDIYVRWRRYVRKIAVESVGYQATIPDTILTTAKARGISGMRTSEIMPLPRLRAEGAQEDRIRYALSPIIESGNFYINVAHRIFREEFGKFGVKGAKHDLLDAISNGPRVWGHGKATADGTVAAATEAARRRRRGSDESTGY